MNDKKRQDRWLSIRVTPNAGRDEITGLRDGVLQVKIAAPPVEGKANKEIIEFLSRRLGVKRSAITIVKGQTGRNKVIDIEGMSREEIIGKFKNQISKIKNTDKNQKWLERTKKTGKKKVRGRRPSTSSG